MLKKKICLLGAFAVGKTSLVARFVTSMFDERYISTIGVKVDRKQVSVAAGDVDLMIWDIAGEGDFQRINPTYLKGASGCLLVADGTRASTLQQALEIDQRFGDALAGLPSVVVVNKADLAAQWEIDAARLDALRAEGRQVFTSSARTGENVDLAFEALATAMLAGNA